MTVSGTVGAGENRTVGGVSEVQWIWELEW